MRQKEPENPDVSLKVWSTDYLAYTSPGLQWGINGTEGARDMQGKTNLHGFCAKAGETAVITPFLGPSPRQSTGGHHLACIKPSPHMAYFEATWL